MLVCVWSEMYAAIPRIKAKEWMDAYVVQIVSNPYTDKNARENILESWRNLINGSLRNIAQAKKSGREFLADGTEVRRHVGLPLKEIERVIRTAFGRAIRD